jgi:hypothetical protein
LGDSSLDGNCDFFGSRSCCFSGHTVRLGKVRGDED